MCGISKYNFFFLFLSFPLFLLLFLLLLTTDEIRRTVHFSGVQQVSWIRYRDLQLLAVGDVVYVADPRFIASVTTTVVSSGTAGGGSSDSAAAPGGGGGGQHFHQWSLQIQNVQEKDAGRYECQVGGAATPRISRLVRLAVVGIYLIFNRFDSLNEFN